MTERQDIHRYLQNRQKEIDGAALYRALAEMEASEELKRLYGKLAESEERHAALWEERIAAAGHPVPSRHPSWRARSMAWLGRRFGARFILPSVAGLEKADCRAYAGQPEAEAGRMSADEKSHARLISAATGTVGGLTGVAVAELEGRHKTAGGNALRAAVLGANDGLVSNLSLVMGVAGASPAGEGVLIAGLAGLLAGAGSMALGEWVSVRSAGELYERQIAIEREELEANPEEELEELALIYQSKGVPEERARELAGHIIAGGEQGLDTLVREELGLDPGEAGGSAWEAAGTSFLLFAVGASLPVIPFLFGSGSTAMIFSGAFSALGLFAVGAAITLMTGRNAFYSGLRMVGFGLAAAALTFGIGRLIGVSLGG